jgi:hypothetical protein
MKGVSMSHYMFPKAGDEPAFYPGLCTEIPWNGETRPLCKDVRCDDEGRLWSLTAQPTGRVRLHPDWTIQYFPGRWVSGLYGPIFIHARFEEDARLYRGGKQAWSVLAWNVRQMPIASGSCFLSEALRLFWEAYPGSQGTRKIIYLPRDVHVAERVMLVRRLS